MSFKCNHSTFKPYYLCKTLNCDLKYFHDNIKKMILRDWRPNYCCENPDIGYCIDDGNIILYCCNKKEYYVLNFKLEEYARN